MHRQRTSNNSQIPTAIARIETQLADITCRLDRIENRLNGMNSVNRQQNYKIGLLEGKITLIAAAVSALISAGVSWVIRMAK